jgi:predicted small lipoprotein YifL
MNSQSKSLNNLSDNAGHMTISSAESNADSISVSNAMHRRMMFRKFGLIIMVVFTFLYCGKKGPLKLDPVLTPDGITSLKVSQVGSNVKIQWKFQEKLIGKSKDKDKTYFDVKNIKRLNVYYSDKVITGGKFRKKAKVLRKFQSTDLIEDTELSPAELLAKAKKKKPGYGDREELPLAFYVKIPFSVKELDQKTHYFAIEYYYHKRRSPFSEVVALQTVVPVKPVTGLKVTQENKMIKLTWERPKSDAQGKPVTAISGYDVFKRIDPDVVEQQNQENNSSDDKEKVETGVFNKLNTGTVLTEYFEDTDTGINGKYTYYVAAVVNNQVESEPSEQVFVRITDIYPPEIPANLVCFKATGHMFLTWQEVTDKDFSHYKVYRRLRNDAEFELIADKVTNNQYKDTGVKRGRVYFYVVTAVDKKGNESKYSNITREQF